MLNFVCWGICLCVFAQSIAGRSIDFNSGYKVIADKPPHVVSVAQENRELENLCKYIRIPLAVRRDLYLECIQQLLQDTRKVKLAKRSVEDESAMTEGSEDKGTDVKNSQEKEEPTTTEGLNQEVVVPVEITAENSSKIPAQSVSEIPTDDLIVPAVIATDISTETTQISNDVAGDKDKQVKSSLEKEEPTTTEKIPAQSVVKNPPDDLIVPVVIATKSSVETTSISNAEAKDTTVRNSQEKEEPTSTEGLNQEPVVAVEITAENSSEIPAQSVSGTPSDDLIIPAVNATESSLETTSKSNAKSRDKPSNTNLQIQQTNTKKIIENPLQILNSGESSDNTASLAINSTDPPVLFKNGFDDILKNAPRKHNITNKESEDIKGSLGGGLKKTVLLETSKNSTSHAVEDGEISKAGESQEKTSGSTGSILLIVFAALGIVGTLAFAFNYIKKRREDRELNEMIKLEEEGKELKEIKPLIKSNITQNGTNSMEFIDADPQLQVEMETKAETN